MDNVDSLRALARLSRLIERAAADELSLAHYRVLSLVADGDERASRVAQRLALGKPTISATVDALCKRGLLLRESVAGDHRATTLRLTPAGKRVLHAAEAAMTKRLDEVVSRTPRGPEAARALARLGIGLDHVADEQLATAARNRA